MESRQTHSGENMSKYEDQIATLLQSIDALAEARATLSRAFTALQFTASELQQAIEPPTLSHVLLHSITGELTADVESLGEGTIEVLATIEIDVEGHTVELDKDVEIDVGDIVIEKATVAVTISEAIDLIASVLRDSEMIAGMKREDAVAGVAALILAALD